LSSYILKYPTICLLIPNSKCTFEIKLSCVEIGGSCAAHYLNAQVVTSLQTSCHKSVHKLSTSYVRIACSQFVVTSLKQAVNNL
jgi:hypothetical protein